MDCGKAVDLSRRLIIGGRSLPLVYKTNIYVDNDNKPDGIVTADNAGFPLIKNLSPEQWTVETPSGKVKTVEPQGFLPVKEGLKINLRIHNMPYKAEIKFMPNN